MSLYTNDVTIENVITTNPETAKALENTVRAKILDMLANEEMTIEEIHAELQRRGEDKAETTVRHHVTILKKAGMVEIARLEEAGGGTLKYYRSNTRVFSHELPESTEETFTEISETATDEILTVMNVRLVTTATFCLCAETITRIVNQRDTWIVKKRRC